jgi:hypothetical protein
VTKAAPTLSFDRCPPAVSINGLCVPVKRPFEGVWASTLPETAFFEDNQSVGFRRVSAHWPGGLDVRVIAHVDTDELAALIFWPTEVTTYHHPRAGEWLSKLQEAVSRAGDAPDWAKVFVGPDLHTDVPIVNLRIGAR